MKTEIYAPTSENLKIAAELIKCGEIVAFPTETVYGLGGNALNRDSVKKIYAAKGRPSDNPLIVHIADKSDVNKVASSVPEKALKIIEKFMPGPVTIVLPKTEIVPDEVTGGLKTVAVRMPSSHIALELIRQAGCPICAPSANTSTKPSPTTAAHVYADLNGKIPAIIDGGDCEVGVESTVIDFTADKPRLLRAGGMPIEILEKEIGKIEMVKNSAVALCPGMKYKHYSPLAEVYVAMPGDSAAERLTAEFDKRTGEGRTAVILATEDLTVKLGNRKFWVAGRDKKEYAHNLFKLLRRADDEKIEVVLAEGTDEEGYGASLMNRLIKAAGGKTF